MKTSTQNIEAGLAVQVSLSSRKGGNRDFSPSGNLGAFKSAYHRTGEGGGSNGGKRPALFPSK